MSIPHTLNWIEILYPGKIYASEGPKKSDEFYTQLEE